MRRISALALVLVGFIVAGALTVRTGAQEGSPAADAVIAAIELAPGVTAEVFGAVPSALGLVNEQGRHCERTVVAWAP